MVKTSADELISTAEVEVLKGLPSPFPKETAWVKAFKESLKETT